jgi:hypothetical protein
VYTVKKKQLEHVLSAVKMYVLKMADVMANVQLTVKFVEDVLTTVMKQKNASFVVI